MGWSKLKELFDHVPLEVALLYFRDFYWLWPITDLWWNRYVWAEHVKFIVERTENGTYFGRSIFRSTQEFDDPEMINLIQWWIGYAVVFDEEIGDFVIVASCPPLTEEEFRAYYKSCVGTGDW